MDLTWLTAIAILTVILFCIIKKIISLGGLTDVILGIIPFAELIADAMIIDIGFIGSVLLVDTINKEIQFGMPLIVTATILLTIIYFIIKSIISLGGLVNLLLGFLPNIGKLINVVAIIISLALTFLLIWTGINVFEQGKDFYNQNVKPKVKIEKIKTMQYLNYQLS